jgi:hypothetical protein
VTIAGNIRRFFRPEDHLKASEGHSTCDPYMYTCITRDSPGRTGFVGSNQSQTVPTQIELTQRSTPTDRFVALVR